jgi:hypothetical protein
MSLWWLYYIFKGKSIFLRKTYCSNTLPTFVFFLFWLVKCDAQLYFNILPHVTYV